MVTFVSNWAEGIIVAVIIASIIEMILPEGSSKKYIKVVIGIYIMFVIVAPIVNKFSSKSLDVSSILNFDDKEEYKQVSSSNLEEKNIMNIKSMYEMNLKSDIKTKIQNKGYIVKNINLEISDDEKYTINKIDIEISGENEDENSTSKKDSKNVITIVDNIEKVKVDLSNKDNNETEEKTYKISEKKANSLKEYINSNYDVQTKNIQIY